MTIKEESSECDDHHCEHFNRIKLGQTLEGHVCANRIVQSLDATDYKVLSLFKLIRGKHKLTQKKPTPAAQNPNETTQCSKAPTNNLAQNAKHKNEVAAVCKKGNNAPKMSN
eukprot:CAMPEP_0185618794 /NCGR_PEP_ID=MMETSP0436-20130131/48280_1 /TAXON_ID=626734 ORGANISM="Favella taraikaensis, Strain Fe Narragansett Bay" /NCGR_SAMPLE_ID=MMETSP0436 /ASSEMBLY_ACC=CAM_ASM_000390 /LENGTH=111 /DNA_ID=CAMNT_0028257709 /DNA_START=45 /DNA_END=380 /DNA_ORIENTATION=-